jgi:hypothetical protein
MELMPRIADVAATGPSALRIKWRDKSRPSTIDLAGWIATGGELLAPLKNPKVFERVAVADYGAAVAWGDEDGDLRIDAVHLEMLASEQKPFGPKEAAAWQNAVSISNHEAAALLGIAPSTWSAYKAGTTPIPSAIGMLCCAVARDPPVMHAHFRPRRTPGRPRKSFA